MITITGNLQLITNAFKTHHNTHTIRSLCRINGEWVLKLTPKEGL